MESGAFGGLAFSADALSLASCDTKSQQLVKMNIEELAVTGSVQFLMNNLRICCLSPPGYYVH